MKRQHLSKTENAIIAPPQPENQRDRSSPHPIEELQGAIGNQAVNRLLASQPRLQAKPMFRGLSHELAIQPKLAIGASGDKYEREADRVAEQVVSQINAPENSTIQRQEILEDDDDTALRMKPTVQRLSDADGIAATPELETSIQQSKGSGQPLADTIRQPMENALGADFSGVRVHTDDRSHQFNRSIRSQAFTTGKDIFFQQGAYNPGSRGGQELIAHELTHVLQQQGGKSHRAEAILQRKVLTIGDAEAEMRVQESRFLEDEQAQVKKEHQQSGKDEEIYTIRDKWGDVTLAQYGYFHKKRREARKHGTDRFGPRQSFYPHHKEKYLKKMGNGEDLEIIAHGSGEKIGGYTPDKLVALLIRLGLQPRHKGIIWLRGCLAARRPWSLGPIHGKSFIEKMDEQLRKKGYTNKVYGLRHIATEGAKEEYYSGGHGESQAPRKRDRIWYQARPYGPVDGQAKDNW